MYLLAQITQAHALADEVASFIAARLPEPDGIEVRGAKQDGRGQFRQRGPGEHSPWAQPKATEGQQGSPAQSAGEWQRTGPARQGTAQ